MQQLKMLFKQEYKLMSDGTIILKFPKSDDTLKVTKEMEEYYLKMGYTHTSKVDNPKVIKLNPKKDKE